MIPWKLIAQPMSMRSRLLFFLLLTPLVLSGCGGASGIPGPPAPVLDLSKHRDLSTNRVEPILSDRQTASGSSTPTDFDYLEVDSPCVIDDDQRNDRFMLFYEGIDGGQPDSAIGLVTSTEEDFELFTIDRTMVLSAANMPDLNVNGTLEQPFGAGDPTVLLDTSFAIGVDGRYRMWFEGTYGLVGLISAILTCTSGDGINWSTPVFCTGLEPGPAFGTVIRVSDPSVERTPVPTAPLQMAFEVGRIDGSSVISTVIGMAFSTDGFDWTISDGILTGAPAGPVFTGGPGSFDNFSVRAPSIAREVDSSGNLIEWHMFYEGLPFNPAIDNDSVIGYATSIDGFSWSGFLTAVLDPSSDLVAPPLFDSDDIKQPTVLLPEPEPNGPRFLLYYAGDPQVPLISDEVNRIGLAEGS